MMNHAFTYLALDIANERSREALDERRAAIARAGLPERPSVLRRGLAQALAAVSRGSAAAARRLDSVTADEHTRKLAHSK
jgi:hypothetical protein